MHPDPATTRQMAIDPATFRRHLLVDTDAGPRPLGEVCDDWQDRAFRDLDPSWLRVVGQRVEGSPPRHAWIERPRGHSKTSDVGLMALWALFASPRTLQGLGAAGSKQQATFLRDQIQRLVRLNPWLARVITVNAFEVINRRTGSRLTIISSEDNLNYGWLADFIVADEVSHWPDSKLWETLVSTAGKRSHALMLAITNAGFSAGVGWQWLLRESFRKTAGWYFSRLDGPCASWISEEILAEQRAALPPAAFKRLWLNIWADDSGDILPAEVIRDAVRAPGPMLRSDPRFLFAGGLDLSVTRDRTAFVVVGMEYGTRRFRLAWCKSWKPDPEIDLQAVRDVVADAHQRFYLSKVLVDPFQGILMMQELRDKSLNIDKLPFIGQNLDMMASRLLEVFHNDAIDLYGDAELIEDLMRISIIENRFGYRIQAPRTKAGHCDKATALVLALVAATEAAAWGGRPQACVSSMSWYDVSPPRRSVQLERTADIRQPVREGSSHHARHFGKPA